MGTANVRHRTAVRLAFAGPGEQDAPLAERCDLRASFGHRPGTDRILYRVQSLGRRKRPGHVESVRVRRDPHALVRPGRMDRRPDRGLVQPSPDGPDRLSPTPLAGPRPPFLPLQNLFWPYRRV